MVSFQSATRCTMRRAQTWLQSSCQPNRLKKHLATCILGKIVPALTFKQLFHVSGATSIRNGAMDDGQHQRQEQHHGVTQLGLTERWDAASGNLSAAAALRTSHRIDRIPVHRIIMYPGDALGPVSDPLSKPLQVILLVWPMVR